jgi:hypothetical protein
MSITWAPVPQQQQHQHQPYQQGMMQPNPFQVIMLAQMQMMSQMYSMNGAMGKGMAREFEPDQTGDDGYSAATMHPSQRAPETNDDMQHIKDTLLSQYIPHQPTPAPIAETFHGQLGDASDYPLSFNSRRLGLGRVKLGSLLHPTPKEEVVFLKKKNKKKK